MCKVFVENLYRIDSHVSLSVCIQYYTCIEDLANLRLDKAYRYSEVSYNILWESTTTLLREYALEKLLPNRSFPFKTKICKLISYITLNFGSQNIISKEIG